jgi:hypothetical protein
VTSNDISRIDEQLLEMQTYDLDNMYISPLTTFSHLKEAEGFYLSTLRLDLLDLCDKLIVVSEELDEFMKQEIDFAHRTGKEVEYYSI